VYSDGSIAETLQVRVRARGVACRNSFGLQAKVILLDESNDLVFLQIDWTKEFSASAVPNMIANATLRGCCKMPPPVGGNVGMFNNAAAGLLLSVFVFIFITLSMTPFAQAGPSVL
jgi:hypothetical protein